MTERNKEINVHKEMLKAQIKCCDTERQTIRYNIIIIIILLTHLHMTHCLPSCSTELHNRIAKVDRLRKKYEILMMSMSPSEGEEEHSQTYYVIKVPPERDDQ